MAAWSPPVAWSTGSRTRRQPVFGKSVDEDETPSWLIGKESFLHDLNPTPSNHVQTVL